MTKAQHLALQDAPDLPQALCDPTRAAQIIGNLLGNAIKYTPREGLIRITVDLAPEEGFLQVSVADNGVGIAPEDQDKLFRRFFRAASATQTRASGTGLGLYIARSLVELHGGRIWLDSDPSTGSVFYVTFPISG
jgi:signal transduction histidine kinase